MEHNKFVDEILDQIRLCEKSEGNSTRENMGNLLRGEIIYRDIHTHGCYNSVARRGVPTSQSGRIKVDINCGIYGLDRVFELVEKLS